MKKRIVFIILAVFFLAWATMATTSCADPYEKWSDTNITLSWNAVTEYANGSVMEPGDLEKYLLNCGTAPDFSPVTVDVGLVTSYMISGDLPNGPTIYDCVAKACTAPKCSGNSNMVTLTRPPKDVAAPVNLVVSGVSP